MSQHDFNIANQSFPATRTDLNNALQALASNSSGDAEPSTTFANQWWYETDTNTLKLRNEANNAWLSFATVDQSTAAWTLAHDVTVSGAITVGQINAASGSKIYTAGSGTYELDIAGALTLSSGRDNGASMLFEVSNSEKMRIDAGGRAGIGTAPSVTLHVKSANPVFGLETTSAVASGGTVYSELRDSSGTVFTSGFAGLANCYQFSTSAAAGFMRFLTGAGAEALRIDSSGNLLIGTVSQIIGTHDHTLGVSAAGIDTPISTDVNETVSRYAIDFHNPNGRVGSVTTNGSATSYNTSSDYRLKTDAQPMTGASARVLALKPVNFAWIVDGSRVDGFLAHEAQEVVPEAVHGTKDAMRDEEYEVTAAVYEDIIIAAVLDEEGNELEAERTEQRLVSEAVMGTRSVPDMQGIDQSKLVPLLTAALQEALTKISALEARVAALEA